MAPFQFTYLNGSVEHVGADRVEYDEAARNFVAHCDTEGPVYIAPAVNVLSIRKNPPLDANTTIDVWIGGNKLNADLHDTLRTIATRAGHTIR